MSSDECSWKKCGRPVSAKGLCNPHYLRQHRGKDMDAPIRERLGDSRWIKKGYVAIWVGDRTMYEHRFVMETMLDRELLPGETVYHKNGCKTDNRPENLELWVTSQPAGQRPHELVEWAKEIIERYGDSPAA